MDDTVELDCLDVALNKQVLDKISQFIQQ